MPSDARARPADRPSLVARGKALFLWWKHTRPGRASARFRARSGGVLSGGIAYAALFSVFAALTISYTVFIAILGDNDELREGVLVAVDTTYPHLLDTGDGGGCSTRSPSSYPAALHAGRRAWPSSCCCWAGARPVGGLRGPCARCLRGSGFGGNPMLGKARDLGGFVGLVFAVAALGRC